MKIYELIEQHFNKDNIEQNFVITSHYDNEEEAVQEFSNTCEYELQDIADIEEDMHDSACDADELNAKIEQYRYYAEDEKYMRVYDTFCALNEDNIIAYYACYKNEYRKESDNIRLILKEIEF